MKVKTVLAPGVYQMEDGSYRVIARVGDRKTGPREGETLAGYWGRSAARLSKECKVEPDAWLPRFGPRRRDAIQTEDLEQQVRDWRHAGLAAGMRPRLSA